MKTRPVTYDQEKVKLLRMEIIQAALDVMQNKKSTERWSAYKKELILKMAPRALPQLNAGRDDDKDLFPEPLLGGKTKYVQDNNSHEQTVEDDKED